MSKPSPKNNLVQTMLLMLTIFLGFQLLMPKQEADKSTLEQLKATLVQENTNLMDVSIAETYQKYTKKLSELEQQGKLKPEDSELKKQEAAILVADTQLKDGLYRDDTNRIRAAYQTLLPFQKRLLDQKSWNTPVQVYSLSAYAPHVVNGEPIATSVRKFDWKSWTGQGLYKYVVETLSKRNQSELVYGFIPGYALMNFLVNITGAKAGFSYAFAALLLALSVRAIVFPLSQKQLMFSRQMSQLVPLTNEIKQKYKDQATQQQKVMELYREYGINPMAGCFPALIQMPLFLTVYQCMLRFQFKFQEGTFLWINAETSKNTHGFVAPNLGQQDYILIAIYGITMVTATLLTPVTDPTQAKQQRLMGVGVSLIFTFFMFTGAFPVVSGFVLYWTFTNILATAQSLRAYRLPLPPLVKVNAAGGGVLPKPSNKWQQMMDKIMEEQKRQEELRKGAAQEENKPYINEEKRAQKKDADDDSGGSAKHKPKKRK